MIKCYYAEATLDKIGKSGCRQAIGCACVWYGLLALFLIVMFVNALPIWCLPFDAIVFWVVFVVLWMFPPYFVYLAHIRIREVTLQHAGDEITLDDNEIRLVKANGTQIVFPRAGLQIQRSNRWNNTMVFEIRNYRIDWEHAIVLTTDMKNASELIETIQPGLLESLRKQDIGPD
jgi:hypothetical protein